MSGDLRVEHLLEEILDSDCTPEEACGDCPELLPRVKARLRQIRAVDAQFDALFPSPGSRRANPVSAEAGPPHFPGFEVRELLGRGGMGVVYKARHRRLNRDRGAQDDPRRGHAGPEELARFRARPRRWPACSTPTSCQIYEVGEQDGRPYFALEFVEGGSLAQRLAGTPLPAREAAALVETLAEAVQAAHDGGVVHRDLKPANVLLTADGTPKITDFGLAKRLDGEAGLTQTGDRARARPATWPPSRPRAGRTRSGRPRTSTRWGRSSTRLLTGRPPFRAATVGGDDPRRSSSDEPVPPSRLERRGAARPGDDLPEVPAQGAGGALPERGGPGGRPAPVPAGRADHGPGPGPGGAAGPVDAAPAGPGGGPGGGPGAGDRPGRRRALAVVGGACDRAGGGGRPAGGGPLAAGGRLVRRGPRAGARPGPAGPGRSGRAAPTPRSGRPRPRPGASRAHPGDPAGDNPPGPDDPCRGTLLPPPGRAAFQRRPRGPGLRGGVPRGQPRDARRRPGGRGGAGRGLGRACAGRGRAGRLGGLRRGRPPTGLGAGGGAAGRPGRVARPGPRPGGVGATRPPWPAWPGRHP